MLADFYLSQAVDSVLLLEYFFFYTSTQSESFWHLCLATPTWREQVCRIALRHCQTSPVKSLARNIPFRQRPSRAIPSLRSSQVGPELGIAPFVRSSAQRAAVRVRGSSAQGRLPTTALLDGGVTPRWRSRSGWVTRHHRILVTNTNTWAAPVVRPSPDAVRVCVFVTHDRPVDSVAKWCLMWNKMNKSYKYNNWKLYFSATIEQSVKY